MFTFNYGVSLVDTSYNFLMKNKRLFMYMLIPPVVYAIINGILLGNGYILSEELARQIFYVPFYLCMIPLIYHIVRLVRSNKPNFAASNAGIPSLISIVFFVLLSVASKILNGQVGALFSKLLNYYSFIRVETSSLYFDLFALFFFYFSITAITIISYFLLFLLLYFVLVVVVVEKTDIITTLKKSFIAAKKTLYSIIGGTIWLTFFSFLLMLVVVLVVSVLVFLCFPVVFFAIKLALAPASLWAQLTNSAVMIISSVSGLLSYTLYYTFYTIFQTLLYLKYKEVTVTEKAVTSTQDGVPAHE